ncbi:MAG: hypothetical protein LKM31_05525 [Sphingobium sp.]|jgi:hypothetical protein|nr:hypothetical protein [Sphingobium sp.]
MPVIKDNAPDIFSPGSCGDQVRPERFAWDEAEAILIFGLGPPGHVLKPIRDPGDGPLDQARILIAGQRDRPASDVRYALEQARNAIEDRFVIVEWSDQFYMQALCCDYGWILEKREGHEGAHFRAMVRNPKAPSIAGDAALIARIFPAQREPSRYLDFEQVWQAMESYQQGLGEPQWLQWERIDVS